MHAFTVTKNTRKRKLSTSTLLFCLFAGHAFLLEQLLLFQSLTDLTGMSYFKPFSMFLFAIVTVILSPYKLRKIDVFT